MGQKLITGNYFDKYNSKNFLVKFAMNNYFKTFFSFLNKIKFNSVLDLGCGEGEIINILEQRYEDINVTGLDIDSSLLSNLKKKYPRHNFLETNFEKSMKFDSEFDIVLFLEVLEHIKNYKKVLQNISRIPSKYVLISVPNEPFFRFANILRLKYLRSLGNTPGHINNFTFFGFKRLIKEYFPDSIIEFKISLIWSFAFIRRKKD